MAETNRYGKRNFGSAFSSAISRGQFLRTAGAVGVTAGLGFAKGARAAPPSGGGRQKIIPVYPTGDPNTDQIAIQRAIDKANPGDTILLKATTDPNLGTPVFMPFNLPTAQPAVGGTINITRALTIKGEPFNSSVSDRTVINGGFATFFVDTCNGNPLAIPNGPVNFDMLHSRNAYYCFLGYKACNGATITNIKVNDPVPQHPDPISPGGFAYGIYITANAPPPAYSPDKICGNIDISNCVIDLTNSNSAGFNHGMAFWYTKANINVTKSQIYNFSNLAFDFAFNTETITVDTCVMNSTKFTPITLFGQTLESILWVTAGTTGEEPPIKQVNFTNNRMSYDVSQFAGSILFTSIYMNNVAGGMLANNTITSVTNNQGLGFVISMYDCSNMSCSGNTISGHFGGGGVLELFSSSPYGGSGSSSGNAFFGNDWSGFTSPWVEIQVYLGSDNNYFGPNDPNITPPQFYKPELGILPGNIFGPGGGNLFGNLGAVSCSGASNIFERNVFGQILNSKTPAIYCDGFSNTFSYNDFTGTGLKGFDVSSTGISRAGDIWLEYGTSGNVVNASLSDFPSINPSYDPCTQIADLSHGMSPGNTLNLDFSSMCDNNQYMQLIHMLNQYSDYKARKAALLASLQSLNQALL